MGRNNRFYRLLKIDKETRQLITWFNKLKQKMMGEPEKRGKNKK